MAYKPLFTILFLLSFFMINSADAQKKGYDPGYIIILEGDTIRGWVQDRNDGIFEELYDKVRFVKEGKRRKKKYSPEKILGYGYNTHHFESVPMEVQTINLVARYYVNDAFDRVFLKVIERKPSLVYYMLEYTDQDSNMIDDFPLFYKTGSKQMVRVTQGILGLKKKRLGEYFRDCPTLMKFISNKEIKLASEVFDHYVDHCTE